MLDIEAIPCEIGCGSVYTLVLTHVLFIALTHTRLITTTLQWT
jgi:hypothetical protein